jgi:tripartite-type tricarboxylate transporter receptor subunit TctC
MARFLAEKMRGTYAPVVIVDNKAGAGGQIAAALVKNSEGDGSTMLLTPSPAISIYPHIYPKLAYDPMRDLTPVTTVSTFPHLLSAGPGTPAEIKTLPDLVGWARANPQKASYGTAGAGSVPHFLGVVLAREAGIELTHVPYKGDAPAIQDLLGGQIPLVIGTLGSALPHVQAGKLRALATTGPERTPLLPDALTVREAGFPAIEMRDWFGVFLPASTPANLVQSAYVSIRDALQTQEVRDGLAKLAFTPGGEPPAEFAALVRADYERWGPVVHESGFKPEE